MTPRDATPWARARHATIAKDDRARVDGFTCDSTARIGRDIVDDVIGRHARRTETKRERKGDNGGGRKKKRTKRQFCVFRPTDDVDLAFARDFPLNVRETSKL